MTGYTHRMIGVLLALTSPVSAGVQEVSESALIEHWQDLSAARRRGSGVTEADALYTHCANALADGPGELEPDEPWEGEAAIHAGRVHALCAIGGFGAMRVVQASEWARKARTIDPELGRRPGPTGDLGEPSLGGLLAAEEATAHLYRIAPVQIVADEDEVIGLRPLWGIQAGSRIERLVLNAQADLAAPIHGGRSRRIWLTPGLYSIELGERREQFFVPAEPDGSSETVRIEVTRDAQGTPRISVGARPLAESPGLCPMAAGKPPDTSVRRARRAATYTALGALAVGVVAYGVGLGCEAGYGDRDLSAGARNAFGACAGSAVPLAVAGATIAAISGVTAVTLWTLEAPDAESSGNGVAP